MTELTLATDVLVIGGGMAAAWAAIAAVRTSGHLGRLQRDYGWDREKEGSRHLEEFWRLGPLLREGAGIAARRYVSRNESD